MCRRTPTRPPQGHNRPAAAVSTAGRFSNYLNACNHLVTPALHCPTPIGAIASAQKECHDDEDQDGDQDLDVATRFKPKAPACCRCNSYRVIDNSPYRTC